MDFLYPSTVGTLCYLCPSRVRTHFGWEIFKSDVFAVGVSAYEMLTGKRCFYGKDEREVLTKITTGQWHWPTHFVPSLLAQDFVKVEIQASVI